MTAALTATPDTDNWPPRVVLNLSGMAGSTVTVTRIDSSGARVTLRAANPKNLSGGGAVIYDYEAPDGQAATWTATSDTGVSASAAATLPATGPRLVHPGLPSLSVRLTVAAMGDLVADVAVGVHRPLGRRTPIVITSGQRQAPTFDLTVRTAAEVDEDALWDLLSDGSTLLLQIAYDPSVGVTRSYYYWVSIGQVTQSRLVPTFVADPGDLMHWTLPCTVSSRPSGALQSQRTWADVDVEAPMLRGLVGMFATVRDVVLDNGSVAPAVVAGGLAVTDNGNGQGTVTVTGTAAVTDNGNGTATASGAAVAVTDNGNGTATI